MNAVENKDASEDVALDVMADSMFEEMQATCTMEELPAKNDNGMVSITGVTYIASEKSLTTVEVIAETEVNDFIRGNLAEVPKNTQKETNSAHETEQMETNQIDMQTEIETAAVKILPINLPMKNAYRPDPDKMDVDEDDDESEQTELCAASLLDKDISDNLQTIPTNSMHQECLQKVEMQILSVDLQKVKSIEKNVDSVEVLDNCISDNFKPANSNELECVLNADDHEVNKKDVENQASDVVCVETDVNIRLCAEKLNASYIHKMDKITSDVEDLMKKQSKFDDVMIIESSDDEMENLVVNGNKEDLPIQMPESSEVSMFPTNNDVKDKSEVEKCSLPVLHEVDGVINLDEDIQDNEQVHEKDAIGIEKVLAINSNCETIKESKVQQDIPTDLIKCTLVDTQSENSNKLETDNKVVINEENKKDQNNAMENENAKLPSCNTYPEIPLDVDKLKLHQSETVVAADNEAEKLADDLPTKDDVKLCNEKINVDLREKQNCEEMEMDAKIITETHSIASEEVEESNKHESDQNKETEQELIEKPNADISVLEKVPADNTNAEIANESHVDQMDVDTVEQKNENTVTIMELDKLPENGYNEQMQIDNATSAESSIIEIYDEVEDETVTKVTENTIESIVAQPDIKAILANSEQEQTIIEIDDDIEEEIPSTQTVVTATIHSEPPAKATTPETAQSDPIIEIDDEEEIPSKNTEVAPKETVTSIPAVTEQATIVKELPKTNVSSEQADIYYNKECINNECKRRFKQYYLAAPFVLSFYKVNKKRNKVQYVCVGCNDRALQQYEEYIRRLIEKKPIYDKNVLVNGTDCVEIIDSSDDEENAKPQDDPQVPPCSSETLKLVLDEMDSCIKCVFGKIDLEQQVKFCKASFEERIENLQKANVSIEVNLCSMQKKSDTMMKGLYQHGKQKELALEPLDLNSKTNVTHGLPPMGEVVRPPIEINGLYYAVKNKPIASWVACKLLEHADSPIPNMHKQIPHYKIKILRSQYQMVKVVPAKHLAYYDPPEMRLPIGSRVIAYFDAGLLQRGKEKIQTAQSAFYPGIIAEPLRVNNKYRYLIFYDDGYTQYVQHKDVRLVCNVSDYVWEDVHPGSREFIEKYLMQYAINRPMVQTQKGQSMQTESDGKWMHARVLDIDCSLVQMQFEGPKTHTEWIYRGSARLGPVFKEFQKAKDASNAVSRLTRRTEPYIRYTMDEETTMQQQREQRQQQLQTVERRTPKAKKSTKGPDVPNQAQLFPPRPQMQPPQTQAQQQAPAQPVRHLNNSTIYLEDETRPKGKVVYYMARRNSPPSQYVPHICNPFCLRKIQHNLSAYSPLSKPLLSGWERLLLKQKIKVTIAYRAPCGKILRNLNEVHKYLRITECCWNVDNFDFSAEIHCLAEYVIDSAIIRKRDISGGQEKMPIPLVNYYDNTLPPECEYSAQRIPTEGVNLNLDEEFLVGCDCKDDCSDKSKCSCWGMTLAGAKYGNPNTPSDKVGYQYKRLLEHVPTGIYECNSRCKCSQKCLNRVAQHSLEMKLQVFKTSNRGWGLRCLNDVPRGSFICIYAGHLLTEAKANEGGIDAGDEYFAELDYIEVAEQIKEGYESEADSLDQEEDDEEIYVPDADDDDEFTPSKSFLHRTRRKGKTRPGQQGEDDSQERAVINFNPNADMNENSGRESSIRNLFGNDEACYVMDAKITGNLGRYFNHSCSPNLFVQNVFVDTHDLRFPWVAFFSSTNIRAGTELTWNYNYEVGVVPGKVLYCQCGAANCRVRLL